MPRISDRVNHGGNGHMNPRLTSACAAPARCPVCGAVAPPFDVVDFNRSCQPVDGRPLPLSGVAVYYHLCGDCGFCFAPSMMAWPPSWFAALVYDSEYQRVDPEYLGHRPDANAQLVDHLFGAVRSRIRHLDFGGGSGRLTDRLLERGWDSRTWDPFDRPKEAPSGHFDLITAFEVFEHVPDPVGTAQDLARLAAPDGLVVLSTLTSDGQIVAGQRLTWWYAAPRNGHIGLFSTRALTRLFNRVGFQCGSVSGNLHAAWRTPPEWLAETRFRVAGS